MDLSACASVILSAAGQTGAQDPVPRAAEIVGADAIEPTARALTQPWVAAGGRVLLADDPAWPRGLQSLGGAAPPLLWVRGRLPVDPDDMVAVVGARSCTEYGRSMAASLTRAAVGAGRDVVSGGAAGIDRAAHVSALEGGGRTVLFAAGGAGSVYPPAHGPLFARAAERGAVAWEYPPGAKLTRHGFLHRNRLIAATAAVTVVVEAAVRSGALNTGRTAADLGRLVLGVPGRLDSPSSVGVHRAIADGWAALVLGPDDLVQMLGHRGGAVDYPPASSTV